MTRMTLCVHHQPTVKLKTQNVKRATFLATNSSYSSSSHFSLLFRAAKLDWIIKKYERRISATGQNAWSHSTSSAKVNTSQVFTHVTRFFWNTKKYLFSFILFRRPFAFTWKPVEHTHSGKPKLLKLKHQSVKAWVLFRCWIEAMLLLFGTLTPIIACQMSPKSACQIQPIQHWRVPCC